MFTLTVLIVGGAVVLFTGGVFLPVFGIALLAAIVSDLMAPAGDRVGAKLGGPQSPAGCGGSILTATLVGAVSIALFLMAMVMVLREAVP